MKKKDLMEVRGKDAAEIKKIISEKQLKLDKVRVETLAGEEKNVKLPANLKRELAQLNTILREKELGEEEKVEETK